MNLIAHFFLDRNKTDSLFLIGISTPDLVGVYDRSVRLKQATLPPFPGPNSSVEKRSFYKGVVRHFEVDRLFHSSQFFHQEIKVISRKLYDAFGKEEVKRGFFVAHILLELILDRILINKHNDLLYSYYSHFQKKEIFELVEYTEWVCGKQLDGYAEFLQRFSERKFLYKYADPEFITKVLKNILQKVRIKPGGYLDDTRFWEVLEEYEADLSQRYPSELKQFIA